MARKTLQRGMQHARYARLFIQPAGDLQAVIGTGSVIAAGAVVTQNTIVPPGSLMAGVPAKRIGAVSRDLSEGEIERIARNYIRYAGWFKEG